MAGWADALASNTALMTDIQAYVESGGLIGSSSGTVTSGGSANAQTLTTSPVTTSYVAGQKFRFIAGFTNTAAVTLNVNSLGVKNIYMGNGSTVTAGGEIVVGRSYDVQYDGTQFRLSSSDGASSVSWTPTIAAVAPMTISAQGLQYSKYFQIGKMVFFQVYAAPTTATTASNTITFTLPVTAASSLFGGGGCWCYDGTNNLPGHWRLNSTTVAYVSKVDASNFALAANRQISVNGWYEAA